MLQCPVETLPMCSEGKKYIVLTIFVPISLQKKCTHSLATNKHYFLMDLSHTWLGGTEAPWRFIWAFGENNNKFEGMVPVLQWGEKSNGILSKGLLCSLSFGGFRFLDYQKGKPRNNILGSCIKTKAM